MESSSDFSHSSVPGICFGELTFPLLWKGGAQTPDPSPSETQEGRRGGL